MTYEDVLRTYEDVLRRFTLAELYREEDNLEADVEKLLRYPFVKGEDDPQVKLRRDKIAIVRRIIDEQYAK